METTLDQQIFELIKKSQKVLIALPENLTADSLSAALALRLFLIKLQKDVVLGSSGKIPESLEFLPGTAFLVGRLEAGKSLVITVNTKQKKLQEISYQTQSEQAQVFLKAQGAEFTKDDLSFSQEKFPLDLIVCLSAKSPEEMGKFYEQQTDLFFETPKINIDNSAGNEYFGSINLVDLAATSVSEILAELFQKFEQQLVDEDIATCLLTGIIEQTGSFQRIQTTPKSFLKASELVALGGRQQEVIKNIFKTKPLSLLKLWGRALARMKTVEPGQVIYSLLTSSDLEKAESTKNDLWPALREFADNISGYKIIGLLAQVDKTSVRLLLAAHESVSLDKLFAALGPGFKILSFGFGSYKLVEQDFTGLPLEALENKFLESLHNLSA